jgi:hypothetical protein
MVETLTAVDDRRSVCFACSRVSTEPNVETATPGRFSTCLLAWTGPARLRPNLIRRFHFESDSAARRVKPVLRSA